VFSVLVASPTNTCAQLMRMVVIATTMTTTMITMTTTSAVTAVRAW